MIALDAILMRAAILAALAVLAAAIVSRLRARKRGGGAMNKTDPLYKLAAVFAALAVIIAIFSQAFIRYGEIGLTGGGGTTALSRGADERGAPARGENDEEDRPENGGPERGVNDNEEQEHESPREGGGDDAGNTEDEDARNTLRPADTPRQAEMPRPAETAPAASAGVSASFAAATDNALGLLLGDSGAKEGVFDFSGYEWLTGENDFFGNISVMAAHDETGDIDSEAIAKAFADGFALFSERYGEEEIVLVYRNDVFQQDSGYDDALSVLSEGEDGNSAIASWDSEEYGQAFGITFSVIYDGENVAFTIVAAWR